MGQTHGCDVSGKSSGGASESAVPTQSSQAGSPSWRYQYTMPKNAASSTTYYSLTAGRPWTTDSTQPTDARSSAAAGTTNPSHAYAPAMPAMVEIQGLFANGPVANTLWIRGS